MYESAMISPIGLVGRLSIKVCLELGHLLCIERLGAPIHLRLVPVALKIRIDVLQDNYFQEERCYSKKERVMHIVVMCLFILCKRSRSPVLVLKLLHV